MSRAALEQEIAMTCRNGKPAFAVEIELCDTAKHVLSLDEREPGAAWSGRHLSHFLPLHPTINKWIEVVKGQITNFLFYDNDLRQLVDINF